MSREGIGHETCSRQGCRISFSGVWSQIKCYIPFAVAEIKSAMAYRLAFFARFLSNFFTVMITYYLWRAIFDSSPNKVISGFTLQEMTAYVIVSFFTSIMTGAVVISNMAYSIQDGSIAIGLVRPVSFQGIHLAESLGNLFVNAMINSLPFMVAFAFSGWLLAPAPMYLAAYIVSVFLSFLVLFYFSFCFAMLAFYTTYFFGINMAKEVIMKLCSGALIPLSFFPSGIESFFRFLPFSSMNYTPVMIYLGKLEGQDLAEALGLQMFWVAVLILISNFFWKKAIRRLTVLGG